MNSYLGQTPVFGDFPFQILSGDGTGFYELNFRTNGTNGLLVFLNGAVQRPGIDFTCDGDALTFSANVSVGVQIFVYGMGLPKSSLAPSAGSVGFGELDAAVNAKLSEIDDSRFDIPGAAPAYACRAWVTFDGTTTPPTIRQSGNVLSVARSATGVYQVTLDIPSPHSNFVCLASGSTAAGLYSRIANALPISSSVVEIKTGSTVTTSVEDFETVMLSVFW